MTSILIETSADEVLPLLFLTSLNLLSSENLRNAVNHEVKLITLVDAAWNNSRGKRKGLQYALGFGEAHTPSYKSKLFIHTPLLYGSVETS